MPPHARFAIRREAGDPRHGNHKLTRRHDLWRRQISALFQRPRLHRLPIFRLHRQIARVIGIHEVEPEWGGVGDRLGKDHVERCDELIAHHHAEIIGDQFNDRLLVQGIFPFETKQIEPCDRIQRLFVRVVLEQCHQIVFEILRQRQRIVPVFAHDRRRHDRFSNLYFFDLRIVLAVNIHVPGRDRVLRRFRRLIGRHGRRIGHVRVPPHVARKAADRDPAAAPCWGTAR